MNTLDYYDRLKVKWTQEEALQIKKEYEDGHSIIEIGNRLKRTPGGIAAKLKADGVITSHTLARGYDEYRASDLFKEISVEYRLKEDERKKNRAEKEAARVVTGRSVSSTDTSVDVLLLRKEVAELRKDVKKILEYMTSLWEFETSDS